MSATLRMFINFIYFICVIVLLFIIKAESKFYIIQESDENIEAKEETFLQYDQQDYAYNGKCPTIPQSSKSGENKGSCITHLDCLSNENYLCQWKEGDKYGKCKKKICSSDQDCRSYTDLPSQCMEGACIFKHCYSDSECPRGYGCHNTMCREIVGTSCHMDCDCGICNIVCFKTNCYCKDGFPNCQTTNESFEDEFMYISKDAAKKYDQDDDAEESIKVNNDYAEYNEIGDLFGRKGTSWEQNILETSKEPIEGQLISPLNQDTLGGGIKNHWIYEPLERRNFMNNEQVHRGRGHEAGVLARVGIGAGVGSSIGEEDGVLAGAGVGADVGARLGDEDFFRMEAGVVPRSDTKFTCKYDCINWPYQDCKHMGYNESKLGYIKVYSTCISKYWTNGDLVQSYPECGGLPMGCTTTCDSYCHSTVKENKTMAIVPKNKCLYNCMGWPFTPCTQILHKQKRLLEITQVSSPHKDNHTSTHIVDRGTRNETTKSFCIPQLYRKNGKIYKYRKYPHCLKDSDSCQACWSYCMMKMQHFKHKKFRTLKHKRTI